MFLSNYLKAHRYIKFFLGNNNYLRAIIFVSAISMRVFTYYRIILYRNWYFKVMLSYILKLWQQTIPINVMGFINSRTSILLSSHTTKSKSRTSSFSQIQFVIIFSTIIIKIAHTNTNSDSNTNDTHGST